MKRACSLRTERPAIELTGNSRVLIWDCEEILEYEPESVKVRAGKRLIRVNGNGLDLCNLTENSAIVRGTVSSLEFEG